MRLNAASRLHSEIMESMLANMDYQDDPKVGIFWYNPSKRKLFGVRSAIASSLPFRLGKRTTAELHKSVWAKEHYRGSADFRGKDYTLRHRGRIFEFKDDGFHLFIGSWFNCPEKEHILDLIKTEFDLHKVDLKIIEDEHWDIGNGWDGDK